MNWETEKHPSYGVIQFNRVSRGGKGTALFGSSILHNDTIEMRVYEAGLRRDLSHDWIAPNKEVICVEMSAVQFAEAISSMNTSGVPVTLRRVNMEHREECPFKDKRMEFETEFQKKMKHLAAKLESLIDISKKIEDTKFVPKVADRKRIVGELNALVMEVRSNIPFISSQFNEQMDKTVLEAKAEVNSFIQHRIETLGVSELQKLKQLEEGK